MHCKSNLFDPRVCPVSQARFRIFFFALLVLAGCAKSDPAGSSRLHTHITIAQYGHMLLYLPVYVAKAKGYFDDEGLTVELVSTGGDEKTFAAVASGYAQYGVADPVFTAIAREQGKGGKVIASLVNGVPFWGVTFRKDIQPIKELADFAGSRIAVYDEPSTNYAVMADALNRAHVRGATIVQGSYGALLPMLRAGKADIAMELEPNVSIAEASGASVVYSLSERIQEFAFTGLTTSDDYLAKNSQQAQAVVRALARAVANVHEDPTGALTIAEAEFPELPKPIVRSALYRLLSGNVIPSSLILTPTAWRNAVDVRRSLGEIKGTADFDQNVDMTLAKQATR